MPLSVSSDTWVGKENMRISSSQFTEIGLNSACQPCRWLGAEPGSSRLPSVRWNGISMRERSIAAGFHLRIKGHVVFVRAVLASGPAVSALPFIELHALVSFVVAGSRIVPETSRTCDFAKG